MGLLKTKLLQFVQRIRLTAILTVCLLLSIQSGVYAQNPSGFDQMLNDLYRNTVPEVTSSQVLSLMNHDAGIFIDARELEEFEVSHLPGALFVGYKNFSPEKLGEVSKDHIIVLYCSVGYRSERIGEILQVEGYSNVFNLRGGIFGWINNGNAVIDSYGNKVNRVHGYSRKWSQWLTDCEISYE